MKISYTETPEQMDNSSVTIPLQVVGVFCSQTHNVFTQLNKHKTYVLCPEMLLKSVFYDCEIIRQNEVKVETIVWWAKMIFLLLEEG